MRVEDGGEHERLVEDGLDPLLVGLDADDAVLGEGPGSIREEADRLEQVLDQDGLEDVELGKRSVEERKEKTEESVLARIKLGSSDETLGSSTG